MIWTAVGPLIEKQGARRLTMRRAAAVSYLSVGCLYYYFPDKRSLLLFGLDAEALQRACADFNARFDHLRERDPAAATEEFIRFLAGMISFMRPSVLAALELGAGDFMSRFEANARMLQDSFLEKLALVLPDADNRDLDMVTRSLHHVRLAAMLDRSITETQLEHEIRAVLAGVPVGRVPALSAR